MYDINNDKYKIKNNHGIMNIEDLHLNIDKVSELEKEDFINNVLYGDSVSCENSLKTNKYEFEQLYDLIHKLLEFIDEDCWVKRCESIDVRNVIKEINHKYFKHWSQEVKEIYNSCKNVILDCRDVFISYTSRSHYRLKDDFKMIINEWEDKKNQENNLSDVVFYRLKYKYDIDAILDIKNFKDNANKEISKYCKESFAFLQLLTEESFLLEIDENDKNWCFREFEVFREKLENDERIEKKMIFCLCDSDEIKKPANPYVKWCNYIKESGGYRTWARYKSIKKNSDKKRRIAHDFINIELATIAKDIVTTRNRNIDKQLEILRDKFD